MDDVKAVATRYYEILGAGDLRGLDEVLEPGFRGHAGAGGDLEAHKASLESFLSAFPDLRVDVRHLVREGDTVNAWFALEGTHQKEFAGIPATGRSVRFAAWDLMRIRGGRIAEMTSYCDLYSLMEQLGPPWRLRTSPGSSSSPGRAAVASRGGSRTVRRTNAPCFMTTPIPGWLARKVGSVDGRRAARELARFVDEGAERAQEGRG